MSDYLNDALTAKERLATVSDSFCLAKWAQTSLHLTTGHTNSCYHPPLHKIAVEPLAANPSALHNTEHKRARRAEMLAGVRHPECSTCWNAEDSGNLSDRHYRSGEPWAMTSFDTIASGNPDADFNPTYVEVNFSNACNLVCTYCSPQFSSTWAQQVERFGAYPTTTRHNDPAHFTGDRAVMANRDANPYTEAWWRWWPDLYPTLRHFRMTGGEPLMDKNTWRVFDYVLANPKPDLHLNVTSNFSVDPRLFDRYIDTVKKLCTGETIEHFMQFVSVDTWGAQAEYLRPGLDFERLQRNVERYLTEIPGRNSVTFILTVNNLSVTGTQRLLEWILDLRERHSTTYQRVWFDTPSLREPVWQSTQLLPAAYQWEWENLLTWAKKNATMEDKMTGLRDYEIAKLTRNLSWMRTRPPHLNTRREQANFYRFFVEHDHRHGTVFADVFPEMLDWWAECKYYAETL